MNSDTISVVVDSVSFVSSLAGTCHLIIPGLLLFVLLTQSLWLLFSCFLLIIYLVGVWEIFNRILEYDSSFLVLLSHLLRYRTDVSGRDMMALIASGSNSTESVCNEGHLVWCLGQEDPLEKGMATHSRILAWRSPWTENPGGLQSMGVSKSQTGLND